MSDHQFALQGPFLRVRRKGMDGHCGRRHHRRSRPLATVMQRYSMMTTLTDEQAEQAKLAVSDYYLSNNPQEDDHRVTVEALVFLRSRGAVAH